ncbi:MAG: Ig-like domain-containing protein [Pseudomonadota bacterium]
MKGLFFRQNLFAVGCCLLLSACGGSGSSTDTTDEVDTLDPDSEKTGSVNLVRQSDSASTDTISANEPAQVVAVVDNQSQQVVVTFELSTEGIGNLPITSALTDSNGEARVELLAGETLGAGLVSALVTGDSIGSVAFNVVPIAATANEPQVPTSLVFVEASPATIQLAGTGGVEQSTVTFRVVDDFGQPVEGQTVAFSLVNTVGGVELQIPTATSNSVGEVSTVVNSGTVATTVRVQAEIQNSSPLIDAVSSQLTVSTGIPDQNSMSISVETLNLEAWNIDGVTTNITARLADRFNNPVPDGTAVQFRTEGGSITPSCTTENGACTVVITSQAPRPEGAVGNVYQKVCFKADYDNTAILCAGNEANEPNAGRVTVLAFATGEESFADLNSNGLFDSSAEVSQFAAGDNVTNNPFDLGEAFVDFNEDDIFNPSQSGGVDGGAQEEFVDFNGNGTWDAPDGLYNGSLCADSNAANCGAASVSTQVSTNVREDVFVIFSSGEAALSFPDLNSVPMNLGGASLPLAIIVSDINGQQMPAGTTIEIVGDDVDVQGITSYTWANSNSKTMERISVTVAADTTPSRGFVNITITSPAGIVTPYSIEVIE